MDRTRVAGRKCLRATALISSFYFLFDATIIGLVNNKYTANQLVGQNRPCQDVTFISLSLFTCLSVTRGLEFANCSNLGSFASRQLKAKIEFFEEKN